MFDSTLQVGAHVSPHIRLVRMIGAGGMGSIWIADHVALRTQVVVKFMASGLKDSKEATERFSREAAAAAHVKSPHVVQVFDHGLVSRSATGTFAGLWPRAFLKRSGSGSTTAVSRIPNGRSTRSSSRSSYVLPARRASAWPSSATPRFE